MSYPSSHSSPYGAAIMHLLKQQGVNQQEFAEKAGLAVDYVSKLVNGKVSQPRQDSRQKIAKGLGISEQALQQLVDSYIEGLKDLDNIDSAPYNRNISPISTNLSSTSDRKIICNLPAPDFTKFFGREEQVSRLLQLLSPEHSAHIIEVVGIGGVGKTALVKTVARMCHDASLSYSSDLPTFDAIIFVSAKQIYLLPDGFQQRKQAHRNLREIFREIAIHINPSINQVPFEEQFDRVKHSLAYQWVLLIVDNMEIMQDSDEVMTFLYDLPSNVKVVLTSREKSGFIPIALPCLNEDESKELITHVSQEKEISITDEEKIPIYEHTGGLPLAIQLTLGRVSMGHSLKSVLESLGSYDDGLGQELGEFCFKDSVQTLRESPSHQLLMAIGIFFKPPMREAIAEVSGLTESPKSVNNGLAILQKLSLITQQNNRYSMLSLTREYTLGELATYKEFEKDARKRWVDWHLDFVKSYGRERWEDREFLGLRYEGYDRIDKELENIEAVINWCSEEPDFKPYVFDFWKYLGDFAYRYGYWDTRSSWLEWSIRELSRRGDMETAIWEMKNRGYILIWQGGEENLKAAAQTLAKAWQLCDECTHIDWRTKAELANHFSLLYLKQKMFGKAYEWHYNEEKIFDENKADPKNQEIITFYKTKLEFDLAEIHFFQEKHKQAEEMYQNVREQANKGKWQSLLYQAYLRLAEIERIKGNLEKARKSLDSGWFIVESSQERLNIAYYQFSYACLERDSCNIKDAIKWSEEALKSFTRLGSEEIKEVQNLLIELKIIELKKVHNA